MRPDTVDYILVNDATPAYAGVIAHLLEVALRTPVIADKGGCNFKVVLLSEIDPCAPISSLVVSEKIEFTKFDPEIHLNNCLCVLTLSGCNQDLLNQSGLSENTVPIVSLIKMASNINSFAKVPHQSFREMMQLNDKLSVELISSDESELKEKLADLSGAAFLAADCVANFVLALVQSSEAIKTLQTE